MEALKTHTGIAAPFDAANVDTDQIIPKQFLLAVDRKGFGKHLFHERRYLDAAETTENPDFVLNRETLSQELDPRCAKQLRKRVVARTRALGAP